MWQTMDKGGDIKFVLGDTLPTYYDATISFFPVAVKPNSLKIKETINSYANSLIEIWEMSFTSNHVRRHKAVVERLEKFVSCLCITTRSTMLQTLCNQNMKVIPLIQNPSSLSKNSGKKYSYNSKLMVGKRCSQ